jgi:curli biogenesis system outer membrane secretion channel CsgG
MGGEVRSPALLLVVSLLGALALEACQRSPAYRRDQDYTRPEPPSYYDSGKKTATQKIEQLGQPKKRVVVLNFWNDTPVKQTDLGAFAADELRRGLFLTNRMILPPEARSDLSTEDFIAEDKVKVAQLIREGRRLGVAVLIIGRVTKIAFRQRGDDVGILRQKQSLAGVDVELKVFDVTSGRELAADSKSGEATSTSMVALESGNIESPQYRAELTKLAVRNAVALLVPSVVKSVDKMTWQGRIAKVAGTRVYVNAGRTSGLVTGDILKVLAPGDDIYDPATGAYLGRTQGQLKGTLEVVDFIGTDAAVTEVHTGANFQEQDIVQLY